MKVSLGNLMTTSQKVQKELERDLSSKSPCCDIQNVLGSITSSGKRKPVWGRGRRRGRKRGREEKGRREEERGGGREGKRRNKRKEREKKS